MKLKNILPLIAFVILALWFLAGIGIPCDKFVMLPDREHQKTSCTCIGKKVEFSANPNESPGSYGNKCIGLGIFKNIEK